MATDFSLPSHRVVKYSAPPSNVNYLLTIITVVKDDPDGLRRTLDSLSLINSSNFHSVVWISSFSSSVSQHIYDCEHPYTSIIVGEDSSIFHAMNCALHFCESELVQFLNAGDYFIECLDISMVNSPCLIPVTYIDYFGKVSNVSVRKTLTFGMPYCHQGMILPSSNLFFPLEYRFGSDYLALLNLSLDWPLPMLSTGCVYYDNNGFSSINRGLSDISTAHILRERFGFLYFFLFIGYSRAKLLVKFLYSLFAS